MRVLQIEAVEGGFVRWLMVADLKELPTLDDLIGRPAWQRRAACRGEGTESFVRGPGAGTYATAKAFCLDCPARTECFDTAMAVASSSAYGAERPASSGERCASRLPRFAQVPRLPRVLQSKLDPARTLNVLVGALQSQSVVEVAGFEPASSGVSIGLLRAQPAGNCRGRHHCWRLSRPVFN